MERSDQLKQMPTRKIILQMKADNLNQVDSSAEVENFSDQLQNQKQLLQRIDDFNISGRVTFWLL